MDWSTVGAVALATHVPVVAHPSDMSDYLPAIDSLPFDEGPLEGQISLSGESPNSVPVALIRSPTQESIEPTSNRRHRDSPIYTLNGDVLLNIFHLYRLAHPDEYEDEIDGLTINWSRQRWWYHLTHVCRLWRDIILGSPSQLDLHLFCAQGVPVADMLAHSPALPLTIFYHHFDREITAEDESGILLALSHHERVRRIWFWLPPNLGKISAAMGDQFPVLEHTFIHSRTEMVLPVTFQAPNLRHLLLSTAFLPIPSPLLTATAGLVTLYLHNIPASASFPPSYILIRLSLMAQLEELSIAFKSPLPNLDVVRQLHQTPSITQVTLPKLRRFVFQGTATYLEGLVAWISAPSLSSLGVNLYSQLSFTVPHLLQFMETSENLRFSAIKITFYAFAVFLMAEPLNNPPLQLYIMCRHLDWQVSAAVQVLGALSPVFSVVEQVTLAHEEHDQSSEWHNDVDQRLWRELLRPFTNTETVHVQDDLVDKIFRSLLSDDGEPPLELLPNLEEVGYSGGLNARDTLNAFVDVRRVAGHPVSLRLVDDSMFLDGSR